MMPDSTPPATALRARFLLDLRGLAALRAGLSLYLVFDALVRLAHAGLLYGDHGALPRVFAVQAMDAGAWSLHLANGSLAFALLLGSLQLAAAIALWLGYRARIAALLLWVLYASALARHPAAVTAAEALALLLLSLGLFQPWQARWSVDGARGEPPIDPRNHGAPAALLLIQIACLPALLGLPARIADAASAQTWIGGAGDALRTTLLALAWLIPALVCLPWATSVARRIALALVLLLCALGLVATPLAAPIVLALCGAALLIDAGLWERIGARSTALRVYHDRHDIGARRLAYLLRELLCLRAEIVPAQDSARVARLFAPDTRLVVIDPQEQAHLDADAVAMLLVHAPLLAPLRALLRGVPGQALAPRLLRVAPRRNKARPVRPSRLLPSLKARPLRLVLPALLALGLSLQQLAAIDVLPRAAGSAASALLAPLGLGHDWIARLPPLDTARPALLLVGEREDGSEVDALSDTLAAPRFDAQGRALFSGARAQVYARELARPESAPAREALASYLCAHQPTLARVRIALLVRESASASSEQRVLLRHDCGAAT